MATTTPRSQRIAILIIALVLAFGTLGSFLVVILSMRNQSIDKDRAEAAFSQYQADISKQAKDLSEKYYDKFKQYASHPAAFEADEVSELIKNDLKIGDGEEIKDKTAYSAYYIGWNPAGIIFDQSIEGESLRSPIAGGNLIEGWNEGVIGMKMGGVRELTIPAEKAYGEEGRGDEIPPNTPLKFIVMVIPEVKTIPIPQIVLDYYKGQNQ